MEFSEIASVPGKSGLYKVIKPVRTGFILESLDEAKAKLVTNPGTKVSLLAEVSIYTHTKEGNVALEQVMKKIFADFGTDTGVDPNSDNNELRSFMKAVVPDHDETRVYISDIKKLIRWFQLITKYAPEVLSQESGTQKSESQKSGTPESGPQKSGAQKPGILKPGIQKSGSKKSGNKKAGRQKSGS